MHLNLSLSVKVNKKGLMFALALGKNHLRGITWPAESLQSINAGNITVNGPGALLGAELMKSQF